MKKEFYYKNSLNQIFTIYDNADDDNLLIVSMALKIGEQPNQIKFIFSSQFEVNEFCELLQEKKKEIWK